jgi:hypothetical protein
MQQAAHAPDERPVRRRKRRPRHRGHCRETGESRHVFEPIAHANREVIAAMLALAAHLP